ncbi:MAG: C40 family peptidase [Synechococcales cyanobacterium T60_A2020_003]|nr:C40 family peptidase [Synechococcales cyanobacterium T60_A2020_003]
MVSIAALKQTFAANPTVEYQCLGTVNLYSQSSLDGLATQAIAGRQLRILTLPLTDAGELAEKAVRVCLCEDDYPGWLAVEDLDLIEEAETPYRAIALSAEQIGDRLSSVISFAHQAMHQPNRYLWGGTAGPNYDCSGLMQASFLSADIWLPRDAYQQAAFTRETLPQTWMDRVPESLSEAWFAWVKPGDLIFFGDAERITHVGLYLGEGQYIHSSGKDKGRNGIGIDTLYPSDDPVSRGYYELLKGAGRVVKCYQPTGTP